MCMTCMCAHRQHRYTGDAHACLYACMHAYMRACMHACMHLEIGFLPTETNQAERWHVAGLVDTCRAPCPNALTTSLLIFNFPDFIQTLFLIVLWIVVRV